MAINHKLKLITTQDGSHSLLREDLNETYHSFHGAWGESSYVFVDQCLDYWVKKSGKTELKIFEVGFGTGLNPLLSAIYAADNKMTIDFYTIEPYPVPTDIYLEFNYGKTPEHQNWLQEMHDAPWGKKSQISENFFLTKYEQKLEDYQSDVLVDCIFFDAFAPSKQSEVWELDNIQKCFDMTREGGILSSYCAQGQFKRNLKAAGYEVESLKGAMGKKEMVRGHRVAL